MKGFKLSSFQVIRLLVAALLLLICGMPAAKAQWLAAFDGAKVDKPTTGTPTTNAAKVWDGTKWVFQVIAGGTVPTSTGFPHITAGAQDPAARAVNLNSADVTGALPIGNGGSGQATAPAAIDALNAAAEATLAAASTTDLGAQPSQLVLITGNTTINSFGTVASGVKRWVRFSGTPQLTYNATSLILPTAANITAAAGDSFTALSLGSGNWRVSNYQRGDGTALVGGSSAANGSGPLAGSFGVTETNLFKRGITINDAVDESAAYLISPSGSVLTVSLTNHPWVRTVMSADFSIALSDTSGITNGAVRLDIYADGVHSVTAWPAGTVLPNTIVQPFPAGVRTATFERTQATNYLYLNPNEIGTADLAANAVTTVKITDANVTTAKIADANVTTAKIADANVTSAKLANSSVTAGVYGNASYIPQITVNPQGQVTAISTNAVSGGGSGGLGYQIKLGGSDSGANPVSGGFNHYVGTSLYGFNSTFNNVRVYVPKGGTIKTLFVRMRVLGTAGSTESVTHKVSVNGAAGSGTGVAFNYSADTSGVSASESIAVSAGDYIALVLVTPTWATTPTSVVWDAQVYIE